jgi:hypothetical protein
MFGFARSTLFSDVRCYRDRFRRLCIHRNQGQFSSASKSNKASQGTFLSRGKEISAALEKNTPGLAGP